MGGLLEASSAVLEAAWRPSSASWDSLGALSGAKKGECVAMLMSLMWMITMFVVVVMMAGCADDGDADDDVGADSEG